VTADPTLNAIAAPMDLPYGAQRIRSREARTSERPILDELDSGPPTPDTDDTPYIRYAIDAITRDEEYKKGQRPRTANSEDSYPVERMVPDQGLGYVQSQSLGYAQSVKKVKAPVLVEIRSNSGG
jgi:hypothetical protein